ncbi:MAG: molybdopterin-dependent oxidoreductase, partial [Rhizorhabdus sp.]
MTEDETAVNPDIRPGLCRICSAFCPILVHVEEGRAVKVTGDPNAPLYEGYTCPKGRALPEMHHGSTRLLNSLKRQEDGSFAPISSTQAMDEVAARLQAIITEHGPRSVALHFGTGMLTFIPNISVLSAFMQAIKSPMTFSIQSIDKPGTPLAKLLHGNWLGGFPLFEQADSWLVVGMNPLISKSIGFPGANPGRRLTDALKRGMKLIVLDPREHETSRRAHIHLKVRPGEDPAVLAAMIHVILAENRHDAAFVAENVTGIEELRAAVAPFTPAYAAERAGVDAADIVEAARIFAASRFAGAGCGVGPSFSLTGTVSEYL